MSKQYSEEELFELTNDELREICRRREITGMSKQRKDVLVDAILESQEEENTNGGKEIKAISGEFSSVLTKPDAKVGDKATTTIRVSSGASSNYFPVVGKSVGQVMDFMREVLNVSKLSSAVVNGEEVKGDYILQAGDVLEFLKPAGIKG
jgi:hypothetical protein